MVQEGAAAAEAHIRSLEDLGEVVVAARTQNLEDLVEAAAGVEEKPYRLKLGKEIWLSLKDENAKLKLLRASYVGVWKHRSCGAPAEQRIKEDYQPL